MPSYLCVFDWSVNYDTNCKEAGCCVIRNCYGPLLLLGALGDTGGFKPLFDGQLGLFLNIVVSLFGRSRKEEEARAATVRKL